MRDHERHAQQQEAKRDLERLRQDGDALGGIFSRWFSPRGIDTADPVEVWGTRIGRSLGLAAVIAGCLYLLWAFLR